MLDGDDSRLGAVGGIQLGQDGADMVAHGAFGEIQPGGNFRIVHAGDETQHFHLTLGQLAGQESFRLDLFAGYLFDELPRHPGVDERLARQRATDGAAPSLQG